MTTVLVNTNIDHTGVTAGLSASAATTYVVEQNVHIGADSFGFVASNTEVHLVNFGGIFSTGTAGVKFDGTFGSIFNEAGASISGTTGVLMHSSGETLTNLGSIVGLEDAGIDQQGNGNPIDNRGYVYGATYGIAEEAPLTPGKITNSGVIESAGAGIAAGTFGAATFIENSGTIIGLGDAIRMNTGYLQLTNTGKLVGDVHCFSGENDTITNAGTITGSVHLGGGVDVFSNAGGTSGEVFGDGGNDQITGGRGADILIGGDGNDTLKGGAGPDQFIFAATLNAATNVDKIIDFSVPADTIDLSAAYFPGVSAVGGVLTAAGFYQGAHAHDANDRIIYNPTTGVLYYDSNGNAAGGEVKFATLAHNLALTHADFHIV